MTRSHAREAVVRHIAMVLREVLHTLDDPDERTQAMAYLLEQEKGLFWWMRFPP